MEKNKTKVIAIANQKGGCGKTTAARILGYALKQQGLKVLLIDTDPQASLSKWASKKKGEILPVIQLQEKGTLANCIKEVGSGYDLVILDTRSNLDSESKHLIPTSEILKCSDLVIISILPSEDDFVSSIPIIELIRTSQEIIGRPKAYFLVSRFKRNSQTGKAIFEALEEYKDKIPYISTPIIDKQIYVKTYTSGDTIYHRKEKEAKEAIEENTPIINKLLEVIKNEI